MTRSATTHSLVMPQPAGRQELQNVFEFPTPRARTPPTSRHPFSLPPEPAQALAPSPPPPSPPVQIQLQVPVNSAAMQTRPRVPPQRSATISVTPRSPTPTRPMQLDSGLVQLHSIPLDQMDPQMVPGTTNGRSYSYINGPAGGGTVYFALLLLLLPFAAGH